MYSGTKFEEYCSDIPRDTLDSVFFCFSGPICDVVSFLICIIQKCNYPQNEKRYLKKENTILLYLEEPFK